MFRPISKIKKIYHNEFKNEKQFNKNFDLLE